MDNNISALFYSLRAFAFPVVTYLDLNSDLNFGICAATVISVSHLYFEFILSTHKDHPNVCRTQPGIWAEIVLHTFHLWVLFQSACLLAEARSRPRLPASLFLGTTRCPQAMHTVAQSARDEWRAWLCPPTLLLRQESPFWLDLHWLQCGHCNLRKVYPNKVYYINTTNANKVYYIKPQISRLAGLCLSFSRTRYGKRRGLWLPHSYPKFLFNFSKINVSYLGLLLLICEPWQLFWLFPALVFYDNHAIKGGRDVS